MAPGRYKAVFLLPYLFVTLAQTEGRVIQSQRIRRQECAFGDYQYEGRTCCLCAAGKKLTKFCTSQSPDDTQCASCEPGTFRSHPSNFKSCESCTSCSQPLANLEVEKECTYFNDTVCKCKPNHYCTSGTTPCKTCAPCQACEVVGVACSADSNTICIAKIEDNSAIVTTAIVVPLLLLAGVCVGFICWKKNKDKCFGPSTDTVLENINSNPDFVEETVILKPLPAVELTPHIPAIAEVIGWKEMRNLAMKSGVLDATIESCRLDYPQDTLEQTIHLLRIWAEREGRDASKKLRDYLQQNKRKQKAEAVEKLLYELN